MFLCICLNVLCILNVFVYDLTLRLKNNALDDVTGWITFIGRDVPDIPPLLPQAEDS